MNADQLQVKMKPLGSHAISKSKTIAESTLPKTRAAMWAAVEAAVTQKYGYSLQLWKQGGTETDDMING
jgi:hypothetical protein